MNKIFAYPLHVPCYYIYQPSTVLINLLSWSSICSLITNFKVLLSTFLFCNNWNFCFICIIWIFNATPQDVFLAYTSFNSPLKNYFQRFSLLISYSRDSCYLVRGSPLLIKQFNYSKSQQELVMLINLYRNVAMQSHFLIHCYCFILSGYIFIPA